MVTAVWCSWTLRIAVPYRLHLELELELALLPTAFYRALFLSFSGMAASIVLSTHVQVKTV